MLLHGGVADHRVWAGMVDRLSSCYDVTAWDAPGCGASADLPRDAGMDAYAEAVGGLVDALDLGRVHLVGHSFGGGLALAVHDRRPDVVRSLTLLGGYAGWKGSLPQAEVDARLAGALIALADGGPAMAETIVPTLFSEGAPPEVITLTTAVISDLRPEGTRTMLRAFAAADLRPALPRITIPTLIVHGARDVRAPRGVAEALHAAIPDSRLIEIPGVGHESYQEAPELVQGVLDGFFRRVGAQDGLTR